MHNALVPKPPLAPQTYVRLTLPQHEAVSALAEEAGVTYSEAIRQLIDKALSIPRIMTAQDYPPNETT